MLKDLLKKLTYVLLIFLVISAIFALFSKPIEKQKELSLSKIVQEINEDKIKKIIVRGSDLQIIYQEEFDKGKSSLPRAISRKEEETALSQSLLNLGVSKEKLAKLNIELQKENNTDSWLWPLLLTVLPLLVFIFFFWSIFRQAKAGAMQAFDFTRAKAKIFGSDGQKEKITFKDIAGLKEAKQELEEIVDFLKNPKKYLVMDARIPRGVLLVGYPGTGKTMLAKAIANESGVAFFSISGSEFMELFIGVGAGRVRSLFDQARKANKAIIFVDEIDSIGKIRGMGITGGHEEREQTLNQLLSEMDGIGQNEGIIVLGATNRPEHLDPALLRPGRFDRQIVLDLPDANDREEILKIHSLKKPLAIDVDLREIAERTVGFSGADLANLVNEAAILAARKNKKQIFQSEILESIEKVMLGPERRSHILSKEEKEITAYHETGHALVSSFSHDTEPIRKISIVARGMAAGYTLKTPVEERKLKTKSEFLTDIAILLGGYCAEEIKFNEITTGGANDLKKASLLARKLVKEYGMSSLGPICFGEVEESFYLGKEFGEQRNYSEKKAEQIDIEVEKIIKVAEKTAKEILTEKKKLLEKIAQILVEKETIEREEYESLIKNRRSSRTKKSS